MKTTLQFFKDMGVCDGAYAFLESWFTAHKVKVYDYAAGYALLDSLAEFHTAARNGGPGHDKVANWLKWAYALRTRPEAIMYFGDHVAENRFRTADGRVFDSLKAAQDHRRRSFEALRSDYAANRVINGVRSGAAGAETWEVIAPDQIETGADLARYDAFVCHDSRTGLNHRTSDADKAMAFHAARDPALAAIDAAERAAKIERRITDESGAFPVWIVVTED